MSCARLFPTLLRRSPADCASGPGCRSAVIFFVSGAVTIPLTALISAMPFMGQLQVWCFSNNFVSCAHGVVCAQMSFSALDFVSIGLVLVGLAVYRSKPEE